jgi:hypothetical protein
MGEEASPMDVPDTPLAEVIERHVHCIECGYDLFSLDPASRCPECGTDIALSMRGELLKFANPQWLREVRLGLILMFYTLTIGVLLSVVLGHRYGTGPIVMQVLSPPLTLAVSTLGLVGILFSTAREPSFYRATVWAGWRYLALASAAAVLLSRATIMLAQYASYHSLIPPLSPVVLAGNLIGLYAFLSCLRPLADRIPDSKLGRRLTYAKWAMTVGLLLFLPAAVLEGFVPGVTAAPNLFGRRLSALGYVCHWLDLTGGLIAVLSVVQALRVLLRFRKALRAALKEAEGMPVPVGASPGTAPNHSRRQRPHASAAHDETDMDTEQR